MPEGTLVVDVSDLAGRVVPGPIDVRFTRFPGEPGTGGENATVRFANGDSTLVVTSIHCRGGIGTMYSVRLETPHHRPYTFFQLIQEDRENPASEDVAFWAKPGDVVDISAPPFANLPPSVRRILNDAEMTRQRPEDDDLVGLSGSALYQALGPARRACLLNLTAKARHLPTAGENHLPRIFGLLIARQDRMFAMVDSDWPHGLVANLRFKSVSGALHDPPAGYELTGQSFKSIDAFGNIQVTFMRKIGTVELAADIDIDKAAGFRHGLEVISNAVLHNRTNPFAIREILLHTDPVDRSLDPGYSFRF